MWKIYNMKYGELDREDNENALLRLIWDKSKYLPGKFAAIWESNTNFDTFGTNVHNYKCFERCF